jgi:hypothetical protein
MTTAAVHTAAGPNLRKKAGRNSLPVLARKLPRLLQGQFAKPLSSAIRPGEHPANPGHSNQVAPTVTVHVRSPEWDTVIQDLTTLTCSVFGCHFRSKLAVYLGSTIQRA